MNFIEPGALWGISALVAFFITGMLGFACVKSRKKGNAPKEAFVLFLIIALSCGALFVHDSHKKSEQALAEIAYVSFNAELTSANLRELKVPYFSFGDDAIYGTTTIEGNGLSKRIQLVHRDNALMLEEVFEEVAIGDDNLLKMSSTESFTESPPALQSSEGVQVSTVITPRLDEGQ